MGEELYFELKQMHRTQKEEILLKDICSFICDEKEKERYGNIPIALKREVMTIDAFMVVELIKREGGRIGLIQPMGNTKCTVERQEKKKITAGGILKIVLTALILFFGGAVSIMNFHADVNMKEVHAQIYEFSSGIQAEQASIVSIPYAAGIFLGFLVLLNGFSFGKQRSVNGVELSIHEYRKKIKNYIDEKEDENGE